MQAELVTGKRCHWVSKRPSPLPIQARSPPCFTPELGLPGLSLGSPGWQQAASQPAEHESMVASLSPHQIESVRA